MKKLFLFAVVVAGTQLKAQLVLSSRQDSTGSVTISSYAEVYYQYDFNKPSDNNRPGFIYSHNRHNEFNLNLGFIKANYTAQRVRANIALAAGTYVNANYSAEPGMLKNIFEANAGIKISKQKNLWIDAGIMPSHIGFESAVSKDCRNLTRSMLAENSPYFETGAKITYTSDNGKWLLSGMALNGWQRITRVNGNSLMSWGTQIQYRPSDKTLFNYSTFIGTDKPDSARLVRLFHNFYTVFNITKKLGIIAGFDIGSEQKSPGSKNNNMWLAPVLTMAYAINNRWSIAGRIEHYNDKKQVIITTAMPNGFRVTGYSLNIDYSLLESVLVRTEIRNFYSKDNIFNKPTGAANNNTFFTSSIAISF